MIRKGKGDKKIAHKWKNAIILPEKERDLALRLIRLGFGVDECCRVMGRGNTALYHTRSCIPEFAKEFDEAWRAAKNTVVEEALIRKANGYQTCIETYVPVLDENKNPIIKDGQTVMRLQRRVVREAAPNLGAMRTWLAANQHKYDFLQNQFKNEQVNQILNVAPEELKKKLEARVEELKSIEDKEDHGTI